MADTGIVAYAAGCGLCSLCRLYVPAALHHAAALSHDVRGLCGMSFKGWGMECPPSCVKQHPVCMTNGQSHHALERRV